ncbi:mast cell protease 8 isoform X2 [Eucyclogobius newberryi]|uniref:mast cell protease 8 isoform X2 n=1 Tax=Eucyclogobius newberryi TaxID=166745 RepID=UPI003B5AA866
MHPRGALLILILALTAQVQAGRIFGGSEALPHSRPYMVLVEGRMLTGKKKYCGGFLLREDFVMTAAHCVSSHTVKLGVHDGSKEEANVQSIPVEQAFPNKDYDKETFRNDILLLKLSSKAELNSNVATIAMAGPEDGAPRLCSVAGWGCSDHYGAMMTPVLMEVNVTLGPCRNQHQNSDFYCSKGRKGIGSGDSGGPLVCEHGKVYGVVSAKQMIEPIFHLFAKVQKHSDWINNIMNGH